MSIWVPVNTIFRRSLYLLSGILSFEIGIGILLRIIFEHHLKLLHLLLAPLPNNWRQASLHLIHWRIIVVKLILPFLCVYDVLQHFSVVVIDNDVVHSRLSSLKRIKMRYLRRLLLLFVATTRRRRVARR